MPNSHCLLGLVYCCCPVFNRRPPLELVNNSLHRMPIEPIWQPWLIKRFIKKINADLASFTWSCLNLPTNGIQKQNQTTKIFIVYWKKLLAGRSSMIMTWRKQYCPALHWVHKDTFFSSSVFSDKSHNADDCFLKTPARLKPSSQGSWFQGKRREERGICRKITSCVIGKRTTTHGGQLSLKSNIL